MIRRKRKERGSALVMIIILSVVITATVMMLSLTAGTEVQQASAYSKVDKSFCAAEAGLQTVAWRIKHGEVTGMSTLSGTVGDCTYSASWTIPSSGTYAVESIGYDKTASATVRATCTAPSSTAISVGGSMNLAVSTIQGDVVVLGGVTQSGSGLQLLTSIQGRLLCAGTIPMLTANGNTQLNLLLVTIAYASGGFYANLTGLTKASAATYYANEAALKGPDVSSLGLLVNIDVANGYGGCFRIGGNASIILPTTFTGPGTVVIDGDLLGVGATFGSPSAPVNVVCKGNCTLVASTIYGNLYVCKNLSPIAAGALTISGGSIVVDGNMSLGVLSSLQVVNTPATPLQIQAFNAQ